MRVNQKNGEKKRGKSGRKELKEEEAMQGKRRAKGAETKQPLGDHVDMTVVACQVIWPQFKRRVVHLNSM